MLFSGAQGTPEEESLGGVALAGLDFLPLAIRSFAVSGVVLATSGLSIERGLSGAEYLSPHQISSKPTQREVGT